MKAEYPKLTYKQHTFLSSFISGLSMIVVTLIICGTVIVIYGMNLAGDKSQEVISLAQSAIHGLPAIRESLPPVVSDVLNNSRDPAYRDKIEIIAVPSVRQGNSNLGASITIINKGSKVVSLMSLRIVILNSKNDILTEMNEWVVTPIAGKNNWPGPLMPGSKRYLSAYGKNAFNISNLSDLKTEVEITEIRIWNKENPVQMKDVNEPA
jgi:hypothetical protein